ncbi:MAG: methyltransferase domain-containing protein [Candidatus Moranbacteria bacterium]|nr:methyltransferase domain-containing protein [Candidatus Moranbacteria bacterium]
MENDTENKWANRHPFEVWQSKEVAELLAEFFSANFEKAGVSGKLAENYVLKVWNEKNKKDKEILRQECDEIFEKVKNGVKNPPDEIEPINLFDFSNVDTFLDIGANKLSTINYLAERNKKIRKFIAVDIIPKRREFVDPERGEYIQISSNAESFPIAKESADFVNIQFVFHHFENKKATEMMLENCREVLKPYGKLLLWEESFAEKMDPNLLNINNGLGIKTDKFFTDKFYSLDENKRWEFIIANDWLINVNNPHMPWTGQYYKWGEWIKIFQEAGFVPEKEYNFGLRINGRVKQGLHILGLFKKL